MGCRRTACRCPEGKRMGLSGNIADPEMRTSRHPADPAQVDADLRLPAPDLGPELIASETVHSRKNQSGPSNLALIVLKVPHVASAPLSAWEIDATLRHRAGSTRRVRGQRYRRAVVPLVGGSRATRST